MKSVWLDRVIDSVADRGRELLRLRGGDKASDVEKLCLALLSEKGEASGTALARDVTITYAAMSEDERLAFFDMLNTRFGPDEQAIVRAAEAFKTTRGIDDYLVLSKAVEPVDRALEGRDYLAGDFSAADIMLGHSLFMANRLGQVSDELSNLKAYLGRIESRPAFQKAISL